RLGPGDELPPFVGSWQRRFGGHLLVLELLQNLLPRLAAGEGSRPLADRRQINICLVFLWAVAADAVRFDQRRWIVGATGSCRRPQQRKPDEEPQKTEMGHRREPTVGGEPCILAMRRFGLQT